MKDEMFDYRKYYTNKAKKTVREKDKVSLNPLEKAHLFKNKLF